jgi:hypothetical protein
MRVDLPCLLAIDSDDGGVVPNEYQVASDCVLFIDARPNTPEVQYHTDVSDQS